MTGSFKVTPFACSYTITNSVTCAVLQYNDSNAISLQRTDKMW